MAKTGSIFLNLIKSLTPKKIEDIISHFTDIDKILGARDNHLRQISSLNDKDIRMILSAQNSGILEKELKLIDKEKVTVIDIFDPVYPQFLKEISHPPLVLYIKGEAPALDKFLFAIVGTRIPTLYGMSLAEDFSYKLASLGLVIVSGLARGIDTAAHKGALKAGQTVAVLGSGLANVYPKENKRLFEQIIAEGAVISEFALNEPPLKENFPRRNRIVSGLCRGVLVVEAAVKSGALITAHLALEQNREVFAIPGKADSPLSKGAHHLIKEGAKLVDCLEDILQELNIEFKEIEANRPSLEPLEQTIFDLINREGVYLEEIIIKGQLEQSIANKALLNLQLKGLIKEPKPSCFVRI
jgi:DNA processing protein